LSNFWLCDVGYEGWVYKSSEHAYQAAKSIKPNVRLMIANCETPGQARRMARTLPLPVNWAEVRIKIMTQIVRTKFLMNHDLLKALIETGNENLVENNVWKDSFWGVYKGKGENWLGKILMGIRDELKAEV